MKKTNTIAHNNCTDPNIIIHNHFVRRCVLPVIGEAIFIWYFSSCRWHIIIHLQVFHFSTTFT